MAKRVSSQIDAASTEIPDEEDASKSKKQRSDNSSVDESTSETQSGTGLIHTLHGNIFQLKLLMLFLIRGIKLDLKFKLGTEMPGQGGKFDDLIFCYQDAPGGEERYRYLQAKHKQSEKNKIKASDLLNETDGDFSLQKYFRSYRNEIAKQGRNVQDCIICTNIGFDENQLKQNGFVLVKINFDDNMLAFKPESYSKVPARYKLNKTQKLEDLLIKSSNLHRLAKKLLECIKNKSQLTLKVDIFKMFHVALVNENVIQNSKVKWTFHRDFIKDTNPITKPFREIIFELWSQDNNSNIETEFKNYLETATFNCSRNFGISKEPSASDKQLDDIVTAKEIDEFLDKLVFAVDMPDEVRLGKILKKEVGKHFQLRESDLQSSFILEKMLDWFKKKQGTDMLKTEGDNLLKEIGRIMIALRATAISIDFCKNYFPDSYETFFDEKTITDKANELEEFLKTTQDNKILKISTGSLKCTTIKIIAALKTLLKFKDSEDGYLLVQSKDLESKGHMKEWVQAAMEGEKSHEVLVVIGENPIQMKNYEEELMPIKHLQKKMIFICSKDLGNNCKRDEIDLKMLSEVTLNQIMSTKVTFQGNKLTLGNLGIKRGELKDILDLSSIEEILFHQNVSVLSFDTNEFEKLLWIERSLLPPPNVLFDEHLFNQLAKKLGYTKDKLDKACRFHPTTNHIEWLTKDYEEKLKIWKQAKILLLEKNESSITKTDSETTTQQPNNSQTTSSSIPEDKLVTDSHWKDQSIFIITGVAGSGKSTFLSRHYENVKKTSPNVWMIRINLVNHSKYLTEIKFDKSSNGIEFLIHFPGVCDGTFARSLLRNRLNNTGGVVLMLDGFDEINPECQENVIHLIKAISYGKTKLDRLIITTRPHLTERIQDELFQFAFSLENLGKDHQIKYLTQYWQNKTNVKNEELIKQFANSLVERVSKVLRDKERTFIGIPLQCRILAECFQSQLEMSAEQDSQPTDFTSEIGTDFNIAQLYQMLFQKKRDIFHQEKTANRCSDSDSIVQLALNEFLQRIESFHLKLAINTIIEDKEVGLLLWPPRQLSDDRKYDDEIKEENTRRHALKFGLTSTDTHSPQKSEFLHRTFAEYIVAEFFYKRCLSNENKDEDRIRNSDETLREFLISRILVDNAYEGVRVFLDSMLKDLNRTDETWRDTINKSIDHSRPNRLQRFAQHFSSKYLSELHFVSELGYAMAEENVGILDLMLNCLGAFYVQKSVLNFVWKEMRGPYGNGLFSQYVEIQQRIVNLHSDAEDDVLNKLLEKMIKNFPYAETKFSDSRQESRKAHLVFLLEFMEKHNNNVQELIDKSIKFFDKRGRFPLNFLADSDGFFIFSEYFDDELRRFMKLLITNKYFAEVFNCHDQVHCSSPIIHEELWKKGGIKKILHILKDLNQNEKLENISETVLTSDPKLYERFYGRPCILDENCISDLRELALEGDKNAIEKLKNQFHVAAIVGNEDVCDKMCNIFMKPLIEVKNKIKEDKKESEEEDDEDDDDFEKEEIYKKIGYIYKILDYAIDQYRTDIFALIMRVVRRHFDRQNKNKGLEVIRELLTTHIIYKGSSILDDLSENDMLKKIFKMIITEEEDGSEFFAKVFFCHYITNKRCKIY